LIKVSDYVSRYVARAGVKHVFILAGGGCMHLVDSFGREPSLQYICCLHEQACAYAAEAYSEYSHHLGVVLVTTGPGGTNAVTGVAAAWLDSASCLFLSGQVKRADLIGKRGVRSMGPQEVDIVSVVRPITKYAQTVLEPDSIRYELEKAVWLATHGRRGPVWLDLPLDVQASTIDENKLAGFDPEPEPPSADLSRRAAEAIALLNRAERPVLYIGNGARVAMTRGDLAKLMGRLQTPTLLSWKAIDLVPESNPFYAGRPGSIGQRGANFTQQNADCILILGARLDLPSVAFNPRNFARAATKILVDVDPAEIAKLDMNLDVPVCADAGAFVSALLRQADLLVPHDRSAWLQRCKNWQTQYPVILPEYWEDPGDGTVNPYALVDALSEEARPEDLLVPGSSGPCSEIFLQAFRVKAGQRVVNAPSLGAMGTGLPGTIGACLASGRRRTICVNGDGGFQLNIQDLETVRRLQLPIKYFIWCNGGYGSIMATQRNYFRGHYVASEAGSGLTLPDITRVAEAYGIPSVRLGSHRQLRDEVRAVLDREGPVVCAVNMRPDQPTLPRVTSKMLRDGSMVTLPMEDLAPLLPRDEFLENMIIPPLGGTE
jgi:acetolactate synthase-1/2/3 large subunit